MANAKIEKVEVPQPPIIPPPLFEERVHLVLTKEEATTLADLLGRGVLGNHNSRCKHTTAVFESLYAIGIYTTPAGDMTGYVTFNQ